MDSEKFPTASFVGTIKNPSAVNFTKDGVYKVTVKGDLTMHGVTKPVETTGTVTVSGGAIKTTSSFSVKLEDYGVDGPAVGAGKVSKEPAITVSAEF
jgi:polyisoprenoid-binding protein YceI